MIKTSSGGQYREPEPSFVQPISDVDGKDFVDVVVDKVVSVGDIHFIYFKSTEAHVKINLGSISYTGILQPVVSQGAMARYSVNGSRVDFDGWSLVRDKNYKWVFEENLLRSVVKEVLPEPVVITKPVQPVSDKKTTKKTETTIKQKELYEIFNFYFESFTLLCHEDYSKMPSYKKLGYISKNEEKYRDLRRLLLAVQMILEKEQGIDRLKPDVIKSALIENAILKIRESTRFVRQMVAAWDNDRNEKIINRKGMFLKVTDKSSVLDVDWTGVIPGMESGVFKRIEKLVKKRDIDMALEDFDAAQLKRKKQVRGRNSKTL